MPLVTIDGHIGAGEGELGRVVARMLDVPYVDRLLLPGSTAAAPAPAAPSLGERVWSFMERAVRGIALGNAAGDPYFAAQAILAFPLTWDSGPGAPMATLEDDSTPHQHSVQSLMERGRAVLVHRAGAVALGGGSRILKIGIFASWEDRVRRTMSAEGISDPAVAEELIRKREKAQAEYFSTVHSAHPEDRSLYDICINTSLERINLAALKIARAAEGMAPSVA